MTFHPVRYQHDSLLSTRINKDETIQEIIFLYLQRKGSLKEIFNLSEKVKDKREKFINLRFYLNRSFYLEGIDLYAEVYNRKISLDLETRDILKEYSDQVISKYWINEQKETYSLLNINKLELLDNYFFDEYINVNQNLRDNPYSPAPINVIIDSFPPLDKNIIVYRVVMLNSSLLQAIKLKRLISFGYLSTTLCLSQYANIHNDINYLIFKIRVPKGKKCIFYPHSLEYELLFPHNIELELGEIKDEIYFYPDNKHGIYQYFQTVDAVMK